MSETAGLPVDEIASLDKGMGHSSSHAILPPTENEPKNIVTSAAPPPLPSTSTGFPRAQTMLDVSEQFDATTAQPSALNRSSSETALNASTQTACQKSYQQVLEWGRNEQFLKLAHTFHTNNY